MMKSDLQTVVIIMLLAIENNWNKIASVSISLFFVLSLSLCHSVCPSRTWPPLLLCVWRDSQCDSQDVCVCVEVGQDGWHPKWVPLPSLVKPGGLSVLPGWSSSAYPPPPRPNQNLIEAARSSCCYSNRQHWLTPLGKKHVFWHPCSRGFLRPPPLRALTPPLFTVFV